MTAIALGQASPVGFECSQPAGHEYACRPTTSGAKLAVVNLQTHLNALIDVAFQKFQQSSGRIGSDLRRFTLRIDGIVGVRTITTVGTIGVMLLQEAASRVPPPEIVRRAITTPSPEGVAEAAKPITDYIRQVLKTADPPLPAPDLITSVTPPSREPSAEPTTLPEPRPPEAAERRGMHWGWWVAGVILLAGAGYLGYRLFSGKKPAFAGGESDGDDGDDPSDYGYGEATKDFIDV